MRSIAFGHWVTRYTDKSLGFRDPFLSERVFAVEYWYKDSMNDVWGYYEALLPPLGWQKVRELVPAEQTLCGGDWVGVYRKEKMMFKLHACGEDPLPSDLDLSKSEYKGKFLTYYFYKTKPEDVLGRNYNKRRI